MPAASYATADDLEVRWRPLDSEERTRANVLLEDASRRVRRRFPRTDERIASGDLERDEVTAVVVAMVKRVLLSGGAEGVTQQSQTAGPFALQQTYGNPLGNLHFAAEDVQVLSDRPARRAFSIDLTPRY